MSLRNVILAAAISAILAVTSVAGYVSYWHVTEFVARYKVGYATSHLYPIATDGLLVIASLVITVHRHRHPDTRPWFGYAVGVTGVTATAYANVSDGLFLGFGFVGALVWAWPALAFAGAYELLVKLLRLLGEDAPVTVAAAVPDLADSAACLPVMPAVVTDPVTTGPGLRQQFAPVLPATVTAADTHAKADGPMAAAGFGIPVIPSPVIPSPVSRPRGTGEQTVRELAAARGVSQRTVYRERAEERARLSPEGGLAPAVA